MAHVTASTAQNTKGRIVISLLITNKTDFFIYIYIYIYIYTHTGLQTRVE